MGLFLRQQAILLYQKATGRHILECLDELNRTQWLSRDELLNLQRSKLYRLLEYAYEQVPYYHWLFDRVGFRPPDVLSDLASMQRVPVLSKSIIRENLDDLCTIETRRRKQMSYLTTGGSTGHPLVFMQDSDFRDYVTADIHRHLGWAGWQLGQVHAYIWGTSFEAEKIQTIRSRLMDWALNRFVTDAYILSEESMSAFVSQIRHRRPRILFGYPSSLCRFAEFVRERGFDDIRFDATFCSAEVLYPAQRQLIEEVLGGKVFNRYGTRELGGIGCECEAHTGLHVSVENVYVEIADDDGQPIGPAEPGNIIVTNLNNYGMPFIRYSLADVGSWYPADTCPCGRAHPMLSVVEGRHNDMFKTRDGRVVWGGITNSLWGMAGVKQFQIVQKAYDLIIVRVVKEGGLQPAEQSRVKKAIHTALGDNVKVEFEFPAVIPVTKSGKHRYQICEIDEQPGSGR